MIEDVIVIGERYLWLSIGISKGWVGPPICLNHDGTPESAEEDIDPDSCVYVLRMYDDDDHRLAVEEWHQPSAWRKHGHE